MGVLWRKGKADQAGGEMLRVHHSLAGQRSLVCFLGDATTISETRVHWISEEGNSGHGFPCFGENCRLCPPIAPRRWYAPVLVYLPRLPHAEANWTPPPPPYAFDGLKWRRAVLEITQGWSSIVAQAGAGNLFHLVRPRGGKQTRTSFAFLGKVEGVPPGLCFDPQAVMMRVWGIDKFYPGGEA